MRKLTRTRTENTSARDRSRSNVRRFISMVLVVLLCILIPIQTTAVGTSINDEVDSPTRHNYTEEQYRFAKLYTLAFGEEQANALVCALIDSLNENQYEIDETTSNSESVYGTGTANSSENVTVENNSDNPKIVDIEPDITENSTQNENSVNNEEEVVASLPITCDVNDITVPSNATVDDLQKALTNTNHWMKDYGLAQTFYDMEQQYHINAFFAMAVTTQESGFTRSNLCASKNNMFGITKSGSGYRSFNSYQECIEYFYKLIRNTYVDKWGLTSVSSINGKYCATSTWYINVGNLMNKLSSACV